MKTTKITIRRQSTNGAARFVIDRITNPSENMVAELGLRMSELEVQDYIRRHRQGNRYTIEVING